MTISENFPGPRTRSERLFSRQVTALAEDARRGGTRRHRVLDPVWPSVTTDREYQARLDSVVVSVGRRVLAELRPLYRRYLEAASVAQDATTEELLQEMRDAVRHLRERWAARMERLASEMADWFATSTERRSAASLRRSLRRAGMSVRPQITPAVERILVGAVAENVALIKSIPTLYLDRVGMAVESSVRAGRDLAGLYDVLRKEHGVTRRRAALIARDQNNKVTAAITRAKLTDIGITQARWLHSSAGKEPRPTHVRASRDRVVYDIAVGWFDPHEGRHILPGELINCVPGKSIVALGTGCERLWRRRYDGELARLITSAGEFIEATPNHPILTLRGWVPIKSVDVGDYVIKVRHEVFGTINDDIERHPPTVAQVFNATSCLSRSYVAGAEGYFHGDVSDSKVDVVDFDGFLPREVDPEVCKTFAELFFANSDHILVGGTLEISGAKYAPLGWLFGAPKSIVGGLCKVFSVLDGSLDHSTEHGRRAITYLHAALDQALSDNRTADSIFLRECQFARAGFILNSYQVIGEFLNVLSVASRLWHGDVPQAEILAERVRCKTDGGAGFLNERPFSYEVCRVVDKIRVNNDPLGHVYNLQTSSGYYTTNTYIAHNCRCVAVPVLP